MSTTDDAFYAIRWLTGPLQGQTVDVSREMTIGRSRENDIVLPGNTKGASGQHCAVTVSDGRFYIMDMGSTYGTIVNGLQFLPPNQDTVLHAGDRITLGTNGATFEVIGQKARFYDNNTADLMGTAFGVNPGMARQEPMLAQPVQNAEAYFTRRVQPVPTGGLLAWSIITVLISLIPGIVAIVKTGQINKATTVEEQMKTISSVKAWCIVGTVLGVLGIIGRIAGGI